MEKIKIKKMINVFDANKGFNKAYIQITQDKLGTTISINEYTFNLSDLGYKLERKDNK